MIRSIGVCGITLLGLCLSAHISGGEIDSGKTAIAGKYVRTALKYEAEGENDYRNIFLREARKAAPDFAPANWQSGRLEYEGLWRTVSEAQSRARQDDRLFLYSHKRDRCPDTAEGHGDLARWCRSQQLPDRARLHWHRVLHYSPRHKEAMSELGLRDVKGVLLTHEQIKLRREQASQSIRVTKWWQTKLSDLKRDILDGTSEEREAALTELRAIREVAAIPAMERVLSSKDEDLAREVVAVVSRIQNVQATYSLVRHALLSDSQTIRTLATEQLRTRPIHSFAPLLLNNLSEPIRTRFQIAALPGQFIYRHEFYVEGPREDVHWTNDIAQQDFNVTLGPRGGIAPSWWGVVPAQSIKAVRTAQRTDGEVRLRNESAEAMNAKIQAVLVAVTGQELGPNPKLWWDWWIDYNELFVSERKPVRKLGRWLYAARVQSVGVTTSCFRAGTLVWTESELAKIEDLRPGDRVLSQDPETGELAFKLVLGTTKRPPAKVLSINVEGEKIATTKGHPFWVPGKGWRMAKFIDEGQYLHGLSGGLFVESVKQIEKEEETFNLIVEDFSTYFVGKQGILAHDNTSRARQTPLSQDMCLSDNSLLR